MRRRARPHNDRRPVMAGAVLTCAHTNSSDTTRPRQPAAATCHTARSSPPEHKSASERRVHTHTRCDSSDRTYPSQEEAPPQRAASTTSSRERRPICQAPPRRHVSHRNEIDDDPTGVTRPRAVQEHTRAPRQTNWKRKRAGERESRGECGARERSRACDPQPPPLPVRHRDTTSLTVAI